MVDFYGTNSELHVKLSSKSLV